jgi:hypothetical protein
MDSEAAPMRCAQAEKVTVYGRPLSAEPRGTQGAGVVAGLPTSCREGRDGSGMDSEHKACTDWLKGLSGSNPQETAVYDEYVWWCGRTGVRDCPSYPIIFLPLPIFSF